MASAQVIATLVPAARAVAALTGCIIVALLLQAFALSPDRPRLLRGLMVTCGVIFTIKFVLPGTLFTPGDSVVGRVLGLLVAGGPPNRLSARRTPGSHACAGFRRAQPPCAPPSRTTSD